MKRSVTVSILAKVKSVHFLNSNYFLHFGWVIIICFLCFACNKSEKKFRLIRPDDSGLAFINEIKESNDFNIFNYMYFYNGGGVAVGDVNNDGLPDIYFTANQLPNKLYLNKGNLRFEDITKQAGVEGLDGWTTGVTMADINGDGLLDIYVSQLGNYLKIKGHNLLYINQGAKVNGIPVFIEKSKEYGLDLVGFSTQATFFDYDLDGDLDMYMLNHSLHSNGTFGQASMRNETHSLAGDKLLRNEGNRFTDVTLEAGIHSSAIGYGLGISVSDINLDGYPDLYVGNDFHENDYLYINQGDGTFKESLTESMGHTSRYSMGNDIADFNNDGLPDVVALDMLPADPYLVKTSAIDDPFELYEFKLAYGYHHQLARNTLQLNQGNGKFSEISLLAGTAATDWSWTPLLADFDNDGFKDLFISNGILRRANDLDYVKFVSDKSIQALMQGSLSDKDMELTKKMPHAKLTNYMFHNNGDSTFTNMVKSWGLDQASFSNGAAYADLDLDGDLDLIVNNINQPAFLYENLSNTTENGLENNYIKVTLKGKGKNTAGIGSKALIPNSPYGTLYQEVGNAKGFQSSSDNSILFGIGKLQVVDSLIIIWPDGSYEIKRQVKANQTLLADQQKAKGNYYKELKKASPEPLFKDITSEKGLDFVHKEIKYMEFNREPLIPHMASKEGPFVSIADVNSDGLDDFYIGGAKHQAGKLYVQLPDGSFVSTNETTFRQDSLAEDVGMAFFDVDGDQDLDLLIASGGNDFSGEKEPMKPRLYVNDGHGNFTKATSLLPDLYLTASCVSPMDFDKDGDIDVFIGGRVVPWNYGMQPESYLLENNGKGQFSVVTPQKAPELAKIGMIKSAIWQDIDNNGWEDLIIAGEWMPITIFLNEKSNLSRLALENTGLENSHGWWNTVTAADFDGDGDLDLIAGNYGMNTMLKTSPDKPVTMYLNDFDENGSKEQALIYYKDGKPQLFHTKDEITRQLVSINKRLLKYSDFAKASINEIFSKNKLDKAEKFYAYEFRSCYIENLGNKKFRLQPLPLVAQFAPITTIFVNDLDEDGQLDLLLAGNFYDVNTQFGRYDACQGVVLKGYGNGQFKPLTPQQTGLKINGQVKDIKPIKAADGNSNLIVTRNNEKPLFLIMNQEEQKRLLTKSNQQELTTDYMKDKPQNKKLQSSFPKK